MRNLEFNIVAFFLVFITFNGKAQFSVERDLSPLDIARELVGSNIEISNITFNGSSNVGSPEWGIGKFKEEEGRLDSLNSGVVLGTYNLQFLNIAPNSHTAIDDQDLVLGFHHKISDPDFHKMVGEANENYFDGAVLEFDFISPGDSISFNYIFGSDEYPFFVCSEYNDAFGLFLSGPGINGPYSNNGVNLAEITSADLNVGINSINIGQEGSGVSPSQQRTNNIDVAGNCFNGSGLEQGDFFIENESNLVLQDMELNGFSKQLLAAYGPLECFKKYHLKFVIADVGDHRFNSAVFIKQGNFIANSKVVAEASVLVNNIGCSPYLLTVKNKTKAKNHFWNFGDGFESDLKEPEHIYDKPGKYEIIYIATDSTKCEPLDSQKFEIEILPSKEFNPVIDIKLDEGCSTLDSLFVKLKISGGVDSCTWDMGDGSLALDGIEVYHTYKKEGTYIVKIHAVDTLCDRDSILNWEINYKKPPKLKANLEVKNKILGCKTLDMNIINKSFNSPETKHFWDFGDGNTSTDFQPKHFYERTGKYKITYKLENDTFCIPTDSISFEVDVLNTDLFEAKVLIPEVPKCAFEDTITLNFEVDGKAFDQIIWDFGDGSNKIKDKKKVTHRYEKYGPFETILLLKDTGCNVDSLFRIPIPFKEPSKTIAKISTKDSIIGCSPFLARFSNFSNSTKHIWDFGDGNNSNTKEPQHRYEEKGKYKITYIGVNDDLCYPKDTAHLEVEVLRTKEFNAKLDFSPPKPCSSTEFKLKINPKYIGNATDSIIWDFGDKSNKITSTGNKVYKTQTHTYTEAGKYNLKVKAFDNLCGNMEELKIPITFKRKPNTRDIIIPNVFTPNKDGINEEFILSYKSNKKYDIYDDLIDYEIDIFDRYGNVVHKNKMVHQDKKTAIWDGSTPSGIIPQGVYFYVIKYRIKCINEDIYQPMSVIKGTLTIRK